MARQISLMVDLSLVDVSESFRFIYFLSHRIIFLFWYFYGLCKPKLDAFECDRIDIWFVFSLNFKVSSFQHLQHFDETKPLITNVLLFIPRSQHQQKIALRDSRYKSTKDFIFILRQKKTYIIRRANNWLYSILGSFSISPFCVIIWFLLSATDYQFCTFHRCLNR